MSCRLMALISDPGDLFPDTKAWATWEADEGTMGRSPGVREWRSPGFFIRMEEQTETQNGLRAKNQNLGEDKKLLHPCL